jgi:antitoxin HigA-1
MIQLRLRLKKSIATAKDEMRAVHLISEVLRQDCLKSLNMSANALACALKVPACRINDIVLERRGITVDTAMRIALYFGGNVQSWMNLQTAYELKVLHLRSVNTSFLIFR